MLDMNDLVREQLDEASRLSHNYVHPKLLKMFAVAGMNATFVRGEGQYLWDGEGNRFLDLLSAGGAAYAGRNNPDINRALADMCGIDAPNLTIINPALLSGLLAERLLALAGDHFTKVVYTNTGTECTEVAVRFARYVTRRRRFLYLEGAFHGRTYAAISMCGSSALRSGQEPLMPICTPVKANDLKQLRRELKMGDVAGFIFEPVQGMTCEVLDKAYLREAELLCEQYGTILIADEVQSGLGRCGNWFVTSEMGVRPGIMGISKTLSGGQVPVGAVLVSEEIYNKVFDSFKSGPFYFSTFAENNLAMTAGLSTLQYLEEMDAPTRSAELGQRIVDGVLELKKKYDCIEGVRGMGLMQMILFKDSFQPKLRVEQTLLGTADKGAFGAAVHVDLYRSHRILLQVPGGGLNAIKVLPPVCTTELDIDYFLESLDAVLASYYAGTGPAIALGKAAVGHYASMAAEMIPEQYVPPFLKKALAKSAAAKEVEAEPAPKK